MTPDEARAELVRLLVENSRDAMGTSERERLLSPAASVSRAYYAAFYAASAVMEGEGRHFVKHSGLLAAVHKELVRTGRVEVEIGRLYGKLFEARNTADYAATVLKTTADADAAIAAAKRVIAAFVALLPPGIV